MENKALKEAFTILHEKITDEVNPDSAIDKVFAKKIISAQDYNDLCKVSDAKGRCRNLLALLHCSSHPETFIHLRDALRSDYPEIVNEIDKILQSPVSPSTEGKLLLFSVIFVKSASKTHWDTLYRQSSLFTESCCNCSWSKLIPLRYNIMQSINSFSIFWAFNGMCLLMYSLSLDLTVCQFI